MTLSITIEYANISEYVTIVITSPLQGDPACAAVYTALPFSIIAHKFHIVKPKRSRRAGRSVLYYMYQFT